MKTYFNTQKGMTLIEVILAVALLGIISVGFVTVFSAQYSNIIKGSEITVDAFDNQGEFEEIINTTKDKIQNDEDLSVIPEWSEENITVLGTDITLQKLNYDNPSLTNKELTIYLSSELAKNEIRNLLSVSNVSIDVSSDIDNLVADLNDSPTLTAVHDDNSGQESFYANLYRWWKSEPGMDPTILEFPDDYTLIPVSQDTTDLDDLLNNVGVNSYVVLTVTPVDPHGYRGNAQISSNMVYVKGEEWRLIGHPWFDMDNNYEFEESLDHRLIKDSVLATLDASEPYQSPINPEIDLDLSDGSLFVPMMIEPAISLTPGNEAIIVDDTGIVDWYVEGNVNIAKDFTVNNGSNIDINSGAGTNGGSIILHPYPKLDSEKEIIINDGIVELLDSGVSLETSGDINLETVGKGSIKFHQYSEIFAENVSLIAKGSISIVKSRIDANNVLFDTTLNPFISASRLILLNEADFFGSDDDSEIYLKSNEPIHFQGGSWSSKQTLFILDGDSILMERGEQKVNNLGQLNLGNTGEIRFATSMLEDLSSQLRLRILKKSENELQIVPYNYIRNIAYADAHEDFVFYTANPWEDIGENQSNIEFLAEIDDEGPGSIDDVKFSFDGIDTLKIDQNTTDATERTKVRLDFNDKYTDNESKGIAFFYYTIDNNGNIDIEIEPELPIDVFIITFDSNGGTSVDNIEKEYGETIIPPPSPSKPGYTFVDWNPALPENMPNNNLDVTAQWDPNQYTVTLFGEGGLPNENIKTVTFGQQYGTLNEPNYPGFTHVGWFTTPTTGGIEIEPTDIYTTVGDQNLYSRWTAAELIVQFNSNNGSTPDPSYKEVIFGETYGELPVVTRENYNFLGWYTEFTGGTPIYNDTEVEIATNHTLYARWGGIPLEVTFDPDGGSVSPTNKTVYLGEPYGELPTPVNGNDDFLGWYLNGSRITESTIVTRTTDHTLVASWDGGFSCPFVKSFNGNSYTFEHESIPFAISRALETTSYGTLRDLKRIDNVYKVRIAEELDEKSFINGFKLFAVDYSKDGKVIDMMTSIKGKPHTITERQKPITFIDQDGNDMVEKFNSIDDAVQSSINLYDRDINVASYIANFKLPESNPKLAKVMVKAMKTELTTSLGKYYLDKVDSINNFWWMEDILMLPYINDKFVDFMNVINLKVDLWNGENWIEQGEIKAGLDLLEEFLITIDLSQLKNPQEELKIRFRSAPGLFSIYNVAVDFSEDKINKVVEVTPNKVTLNGKTDVKNVLSNLNDDQYIRMFFGDYVDLEYTALDLPSNMKRGFIVGLKGYYYMSPDTIEKNELLNFKFKSFKEFSENNQNFGKIIDISSIKWLLNILDDVYEKELEYKVEKIIKSELEDLKKLME